MTDPEVLENRFPVCVEEFQFADIRVTQVFSQVAMVSFGLTDKRLFICGFWLDSTVSATALDAYVDGYDVHLVSDIAPARNTIQGKSALERLLQIGVVPISTQQLLYEWMTKTPNKSDRDNLHQLIENSP